MLTRQPGWFVWSWERAVGWPSHTQYPGNSTRTSTRGEASLCWCTPLPQLAMGRPPARLPPFYSPVLLTRHTCTHARAHTQPCLHLPQGYVRHQRGDKWALRVFVMPKGSQQLGRLMGPSHICGDPGGTGQLSPGLPRGTWVEVGVCS